MDLLHKIYKTNKEVRLMEGNEIKELRKKIEATEIELQRLKISLDTEEKNCSHNWSEAKYTPDIKKSYYIPPSGGGSDFQPGLQVPAETTDKWTRKCQRCGKVQTTKRTQEKKKTTPLF